MEEHPRPRTYPAALRKGHKPGFWPPNSLLATPLAAKLLGVSVRQMERWRRNGIGPVPEPKGKWRGNARRYQLAHLLAYRNRVLGTGPESYQGVWTEWVEANRLWLTFALKDPWPPPRIKRTWRDPNVGMRAKKSATQRPVVTN